MSPAAILARSLALIRANQTPSGAYLASPNLREYRNSWFRDGTFIADAMSRAGETESAEAFFGWCCRLLEERADTVESLIERHRGGEAIAPDEHLRARYTADGRDVPGAWSNFQLDGYGSWVWALAAHVDRHGADDEPFRTGALLSLRYAAEFWREPCYDWWEERLGVHTATLAALHAALQAGSRWLPEGVGVAEEIAAATRAEGVRDGVLCAALGEERLDASVLACATPFRLFEPGDPVMEATVQALEEAGVAHGGVHRYPDDAYYGGGEWILLAAFLGWYFADAGRPDAARAQLDWIVAQARSEGDLPEQVREHLLAPEQYEPWEGRWGPPASPLLWSHAMFVTLALELGVRAPEASHV
jgi:GH15 family glucan-1,4-alpha-glucosidase